MIIHKRFYFYILLVMMSTLALQGCKGLGLFGHVEPKIIVDRQNYEYQWQEYPGHKLADTTGTATLILDKDGNLYYFGEESHTPVVIMKNVKLFSLDDNSDTLGYTDPFAIILTEDGDEIKAEIKGGLLSVSDGGETTLLTTSFQIKK